MNEPRAVCPLATSIEYSPPTRRSTSADAACHVFSFSGSVRYAKTCSAGAAILTSRTIGSMTSSFFLHFRAKPLERVVPEVLEVCADLTYGLLSRTIQTGAAVPPPRHEAPLLYDPT